MKISQAFKRYARSYRIKIRDLKNPFLQLEASNSSNEDLFKDLIDEIKGFKYQMTVKFLLTNKRNGEIERGLVYFNPATKTTIHSSICLINLFKKFCTGLIIGLMRDLVE